MVVDKEKLVKPLNGPDVTRTRYLLLARQVLSQLSYWPKYNHSTAIRSPATLKYNL